MNGVSRIAAGVVSDTGGAVSRASRRRASGPDKRCAGLRSQQSHADGAQICRHVRHHLRWSRRIGRSSCDAARRGSGRRTGCSPSAPRRASRPRRTNRWLLMASHPNLPRATCRRESRRSHSRRRRHAAGRSSAIRPKSRITTRPSGVTRMLDGLMSRCSLPLR